MKKKPEKKIKSVKAWAIVAENMTKLDQKMVWKTRKSALYFHSRVDGDRLIPVLISPIPRTKRAKRGSKARKS